MIRAKQLILFSNQRISIGNDLNCNLGHHPGNCREVAHEPRTLDLFAVCTVLPRSDILKGDIR